MCVRFVFDVESLCNKMINENLNHLFFLNSRCINARNKVKHPNVDTTPNVDTLRGFKAELKS